MSISIHHWLNAKRREARFQTRAGTIEIAERPHAESKLRNRQIAVHFVADSGIIRREPNAEDCDGQNSGDGPHFDAGDETDSSDAGHGEFLARALSENQIGIGATLSETFLAIIYGRAALLRRL